MSAPNQELALLEGLYARDPGGRVFLPLGQAYLQAGRPAQAVQALEQGLKLHPGELEGRRLLAQARLALGQRDQALAELLAADQAMRELAGVYEMLAELLPSVGRSAEGLRAAILARELTAATAAPATEPEAPAPEPPPPTETATLASIYAAQGLTEEARAIYRRLGRAPRSEEEAAGEAPPTEPTRPLAARPRRQGALRRLEALRAAALTRAGQF